MTVLLSDPTAVSTATPCRTPCPGIETDVRDSSEETRRLRYTWRAGSLTTSRQEAEAGLEDSGVELRPQTVVSGYRMQRVADSTSLKDTATQDSTSWQAGSKQETEESQDLTLHVV